MGFQKTISQKLPMVLLRKFMRDYSTLFLNFYEVNEDFYRKLADMLFCEWYVSICSRFRKDYFVKI